MAKSSKETENFVAAISGKDKSYDDITIYGICWKFFWNYLEYKQKWAFIKFIIVPIVAFIFTSCSAFLFLGYGCGQPKLAATSGDTVTLETAALIKLSYADFLNELDKARSHGDIAINEFNERYKNKKVEWNCIILEKYPDEQAFLIGVNEDTKPQNRAYAGFETKEYDNLVDVGQRGTIEGIFLKSDNKQILLYRCRFAAETSKP